MSNVDRRYPKLGKSALVPLTMLCADIFSPNLGIGGGNKKEDALKEQTNARRLNANCLGHLTIAEHRTDYQEELDCICPVDKGNELSDLSVDYKGHLRDAFRTHEPYAIFETVEKARDEIMIGKLEKFIEKKEYARQAYEALFKWEQTNLSNF